MNEIDQLVGERLLTIRVKVNEDFLSDDNVLLADEINFVFEKNAIKILPNQDTDEIIIQLLNKQQIENLNFQEKATFAEKFADKKLTFFWKGNNSNGYFDFIALSFYQLHPNLIILSEGSVLKFFEATQLKL